MRKPPQPARAIPTTTHTIPGQPHQTPPKPILNQHPTPQLMPHPTHQLPPDRHAACPVDPGRVGRHGLGIVMAVKRPSRWPTIPADIRRAASCKARGSGVSSRARGSLT